MSKQVTGNNRRTVGGDIRTRAIDAYDSARDGVSNAGRKAGDALSEAPLLALAGGLAAGALIAALLPRSRGETELLRPAGKKLAGTARAAADAARAAGANRLGELGLTRDAGVETLRSVLKGAGDAARTSAEAAMTKVRGSE
ncbi:MAG: hypothetical protein ABIP91_00920 [Sphingomicrobium sp.]